MYASPTVSGWPAASRAMSALSSTTGPGAVLMQSSPLYGGVLSGAVSPDSGCESLRCEVGRADLVRTLAFGRR